MNHRTDWLHEEAVERSRQHQLKTLHGLRGLLLPLLDSSRTWFISIATGVGVGVTGAWLDVLVRWCVVCNTPSFLTWVLILGCKAE